MKDLQITAKAGKDKDAKSATISLSVPETLTEAIQVYGEEPILTQAMSAFVVDEQSRIRANIKAGMTPEAIQEARKDDKMGVKLPRASADPTARIKSDWDKIPADVKKKLLADLKAKMAA